MNQPTIFKDIGSKLFRQIAEFDFEYDTDAIWVRFSSTTDMRCLLEKILPIFGVTELFLLAEVTSDSIHPKISEFQGAFGRLKLLGTNKNRTLRKKLSRSSANFFLDAAPISFGEEWSIYLKAVYYSAAGFLLGKDNALCPDIENSLQKNCFSDFLLHLINRHRLVGVFVEDNIGTRSVVFLGKSLARSPGRSPGGQVLLYIILSLRSRHVTSNPARILGGALSHHLARRRA